MAFDLNFSVTSIPTVLPRIIGDQEVGSVWSLNETGLTGITARQWAVVGGANLGTAATQDTTGYGDQDLICTVTCDQGTLTTPPLRVYGTGHMLATDMAVVDICKHTDATKYAVQDGNWTDIETWNGATVPVAGDHIVIPKGRTVTYDIASSCPRFDSIRIDGTLTHALDQNTDMLAEHIIVSRGGSWKIGGPGNRLPAAYTATVTISGRDYANSPGADSDMDLTRDPELWGRGVVVQGEIVMWGKDVLHGAFATAPVASGATSLTLESTPTGWVNGDTVVICPTGFTNNSAVSLFTDQTQEEEKAVTISGSTISWTGGLAFNHNDQGTLGNNQDVRPYVFLKGGRNIIIQSEVTATPARRGHFACMHAEAIVDLWQVSFINMGRTDKSHPSGVKDAGGFVRFFEDPVRVTMNTTQSLLLRMDDLIPVEGVPYSLTVWGTDSDSSTFVQGSYRDTGAGEYTAQAGDTWEDVAAAFAADFVTWTNASGDRTTSILNVVTDPEGLRVTSSVTNATDTIYVELSPQIWRRTMSATSNLQGRYSLHIHHIGTAPTTVPQIVGCYVEDSPGWGIVHHFAKADFRECVAYKYFGSGIVAESGNELGQWVDCVSCKSTNERTIDSYRRGAKTREGPRGEASDMGRDGWAFTSRARALVYNNNKAFSAPTGYVFYHRENPPEASVGETRNLTRAHLDLQSLGFWTGLNPDDATMNFEDYPIVHFDENMAAGCFAPLFITKSAGMQRHDFAIQLSRLTSWGSEPAIAAEYIQHYNFVNCYTVPRSGTYDGFLYGGNVYHSGGWQNTSEGTGDGIVFADSLDAQGTHDLFDNTNDPRWWSIGHINIGSTGSAVSYTIAAGKTKTGPDVSIVDEDLDSNAINIELDPTETLPLILGDLDPVANTFDPPVNADGVKSDNLTSAQQIVPLNYPVVGAEARGTKGDDEIVWRLTSGLESIGSTHGFYTYAGEMVLVAPLILTDRVTGRPACYDKLWRLKKDGGANYLQSEIESNPGWTHQGTYTRNASAITGNDIEIRVNVDSEDNVFNIPTLASLDQGGTTTGFRLDNTWGWRDFRAPNKGTATLDVANATVTYTPFPKATGVDTMYVLARREGRYKTVAIRILIANSDSGLTTPVVDTHFSAADAGSGAMTVTLLARPDTSGRHIEYTEYSTNGTDWRKLTNQWPLTQITVDTASDGTALGTGSKTIRLRYVTDYDYATSTASGDDTVTVT